jgi:hypothetical protein
VEHQPLTSIDGDNEGKVFASLSALGVTSRMTTAWLPEVALQVVAAANEISRQFGYTASGVKAALN